MSYLFSSEAVSEGHPDKLCDQISDAILDAYLSVDAEAKVAVEILITKGNLVIAGEVTSKIRVDESAIARKILHDIGYVDESLGFDCNKAFYQNFIHSQSPELTTCVNAGGAGDQGIMFGYAVRESPELMPLPVLIAQRLMIRQQELRKTILTNLLPDAKCQVTFRYENDIPVFIEKVVLSTQHKPSFNGPQLKETVIANIIMPVIKEYISKDHQPDILVNPAGNFTQGGPGSDTGLTGRKIIVDTYGGCAPHGRGAFSGKDPSKLDRSGAYAARWIAKQIVLSGLAYRCTVQLSYAIGIKEPQSVYINTHGSGKIPDNELTKTLTDLLDLSPYGISERFSLKRPVYLDTARNGHFTDQSFPWEQRDELFIETLRNHFL